jgi:transcriptional regulator with XRE-family HTH domain
MIPSLAEKIDLIASRGGIRGRDVAGLLGTTQQTISRWKAGKVEPHQSSLERLLEVEWLISQLAEFCEPPQARLWLYAKNKYLNGESPAEVIKQGRYIEVSDLLARIRDGAYL